MVSVDNRKQINNFRYKTINENRPTPNTLKS